MASTRERVWDLIIKMMEIGDEAPESEMQHGHPCSSLKHDGVRGVIQKILIHQSQFYYLNRYNMRLHIIRSNTALTIIIEGEGCRLYPHTVKSLRQLILNRGFALQPVRTNIRRRKA